jgi:uncharacterized membrane protein YoaK (UPF0700 family)
LAVFGFGGFYGDFINGQGGLIIFWAGKIVKNEINQ